MLLVVDCSVAAAWPLADESSDYTVAALGAATKSRVVVPSLFWFEIRNTLAVNERRGRIARQQSDAFLIALSALISEVDYTPDGNIIMRLAREHQLSVYDAAYLELAMRRSATLCTLDKALLRVAPLEGVQFGGRLYCG